MTEGYLHNTANPNVADRDRRKGNLFGVVADMKSHVDVHSAYTRVSAHAVGEHQTLKPTFGER